MSRVRRALEVRRRALRIPRPEILINHSSFCVVISVLRSTFISFCPDMSHSSPSANPPMEWNNNTIQDHARVHLGNNYNSNAFPDQ